MSEVIFPVLMPAVEAALFAGLREGPAAALDPTAWTDDAISTVIDYRLAAHARSFCETHGVALGAAALDRLEQAHFEHTVHNMQLQAAARDFQRRLADAGIPSVAIKGMAVADAHDPALPRYFGDIDLLVPDREFRRAVEVFTGAGFVREHPSPWNRAFAKSVNLLDDDNRAVDLQRAIAPWCWTRRLRFADLQRRARTVDGVIGLSREDALIATAMAAAADFGDDREKLVPWRDLVVLAATVDRRRTAAIARRAGVAAVVAAVLDALPGDVRPAGLIDALGGTRIPWTKRPRWAVMIRRDWAQRYWFVRAVRALPARLLLPGIVALAVLPPGEDPVLQWWRAVASGVLGRRALVWQRNEPARTPGAAG